MPYKNKEDKKKYDSCYYQQHKEHIIKNVKEYSKTKNGKLVCYEATKKYRNNNQNKVKAHTFINNLFRDSDFTRDNCCICSKPNAEFHHENYDIYYFGYWFCRKHHMELHKKW